MVLRDGLSVSSFGSEVTVVEFDADIMPTTDGEIQKQFQRSLEKRRMKKFMLNTNVVGSLVHLETLLS